MYLKIHNPQTNMFGIYKLSNDLSGGDAVYYSSAKANGQRWSIEMLTDNPPYYTLDILTEDEFWIELI